ncbi:MAG: beta strand repeat-containing protein [Acetobacteraceae bacterium]|jgi:Ca2+-binding RTX toxin-like protein
MSGTIGNDDLIGTEGHDTIALLEGDDTYQGLGGNDFIEGDEGADSLLGGSDDDWLDGGADADTLLGGEGDDTLKAGIGLDYLFGGAGDDVADFSGFGSVTVNLENAANTHVISAGGVITRFAGIERIRTDGGILSLQEDGGAFTVAGGNDNDYILSGGGNDCLLGGAGDDFLSGGAGDDTMAGEDGSDIISGGGGSDRLYGGSAPGMAPSGEAAAPLGVALTAMEGPVVISAAENLTGTTGNDFIDLLDGNDSYNGLAGDDTALGGAGGDCILGGAGADCLLGNDGADTLVGGGGSDGFAVPLFNPFQGIDAGYAAKPAFADLDGDGDLDMVLAGTSLDFSSSTLTTYRNIAGAFSRWVGGPFDGITAPPLAVIALGDFDGDGDADLVRGAGSGGLRVLRNNGDGTHTDITGTADSPLPVEPGSEPIGGQSFQNITLEDFDNDGDPDLIIANNSLWIYQNQGGDFLRFTVPASYQTAFNSNMASNAVTFLDIDNDGDKDLVGETADGKIRVWRNDGSTHIELTGTDNPFNAINLGTGSRLRPVAADVDGDGRDDLVIGRYDGTLITYVQDEVADTLAGGGGSDSLIAAYYVSYADAVGSVTVDMQTGRATESDGGADSLARIEGIIGSAFGDSIRGGSTAEDLFGGGGNDTLTGGIGLSDQINAGDGTGDLVYFEGSAISVEISGSYGLPVAGVGPHSALVERDGSHIASVAAMEILQGTAGNDSALVYSTGSNTPLFFDGAGGNDTIESYTDSPFFFADYRSGSAGHGVTVDLALGIVQDRHGGTDRLSGVLNVAGSYLADTLLGNDNNNIFRPFDGQDLLNGGNGADMVDYGGAAGAVSVNLTLGRGFNAAGGDADTLISIENARGGDGADTLLGSGGDNLLVGGAGSDSLVGAGGNDTLDYSDAFADVTVNLVSARAQDGLGGTDSLSGFEAALGSGFNDSLLGASGAESLFGGGGDDTIQGAGGHDWLDGGSGTDSLAGGEGNDTFFAAAGSGGFGGGSTYPGLASPADTMLGGEGDDHFIVSPLTTLVIDGGIGNDTIEWAGSSGPLMPMGDGDGPDGSDGNALSFMGPLPGLFDNVTGIEALRITDSSPSISLSAAIIQAMSDTDSLAIYGSGTITLTDEGWTQGPDASGAKVFTNGLVSLTTATTLQVNGNFLSPTDFDDMLVGTGSANQLSGLDGNDTLNGQDGNDMLNGGLGADCMDGGNGNDFFHVDNALDLVLEAGGSGSDTVSTSVSFTVPNHVEQIMIAAGVTGITVTGSSGADIIIGNGLANNFNGGAGDDIIIAQNIAVQDILALFAFP